MGDEYRIGQTFPLERSVGLFGDLFEEPVWFALESRPAKQLSAGAFLNARGVEAWWPTMKVWGRNPRKPRERIMRDVPIAAGYVFARFLGEPYWDRLFDDFPARIYLSGVVSAFGGPARISDDAMRAMEQIPERFEADRAAQVAALEAEAKKQIVAVGDTVVVTSGALKGWTVEVGAISGGLAELLVPLLGSDAVSLELGCIRKVPK